MTETTDMFDPGSDPKEALPLLVVFGYLPQVRMKDADNYVRGLIERVCNDPGDCGYHLFRHDGGVLYEIQEGGPGKALIPVMLEDLKRGKTEFWIRTAQGIGKVRFLFQDAALRDIDFVFGKEDDFADDADTERHFIKPSKRRLYPYHDYRETWVQSAIGFFALGVIVFCVGIFVNFSTASRRVADYLQLVEAQFKDLPTLHYPEIVMPDSYVKKITYRAGRWDIQWERIDAASSGEDKNARD